MAMTEDEILEVMKTIDEDADGLRMTGSTWNDWGEIEFVTPSGWRVSVFNDCGSWDYIDSIHNPEGVCVWSVPSEGPKPRDPIFNFTPKNIDAWINAPLVGSPRSKKRKTLLQSILSWWMDLLS